HFPQEMSGTIFLSPGPHPLRVQWFNGTGNFELEVDVSGPQMARQAIPDNTLFRTRTEADLGKGASQLVQGLNYYCYEVQWAWLPASWLWKRTTTNGPNWKELSPLLVNCPGLCISK